MGGLFNMERPPPPPPFFVRIPNKGLTGKTGACIADKGLRTLLWRRETKEREITCRRSAYWLANYKGFISELCNYF